MPIVEFELSLPLDVDELGWHEEEFAELQTRPDAIREYAGR